ncbi:hypothetical protein [Sphingobium fontiphilum]|nr:hypothetical protein [Sphingobium fontiphilum]
MIDTGPKLMPTTLIERLARHLAAGAGVDWSQRIDRAVGIIALMKTPDQKMSRAGDETHWRAMIDAALRQRAALPGTKDEPPMGAGTDEEGEAALPDDPSPSDDGGGWVQFQQEKQ